MLEILTIKAAINPIANGFKPSSLKFFNAVLKPTADMDVINKNSAAYFVIFIKVFQKYRSPYK